MGWKLGEPERPLASCRPLSGNWPAGRAGPGPPPANDSRGGERISPPEDRRATFTVVSHESHWGN